jgi:hypothetical protein
MLSGRLFVDFSHACFSSGNISIGRATRATFIPFIQRRPWKEHPEQDVSNIRARLETALSPDPVVLLNVRAKSLPLRGDYRSAVLEASTAFDSGTPRQRGPFRGGTDRSRGQFC